MTAVQNNLKTAQELLNKAAQHELVAKELRRQASMASQCELYGFTDSRLVYAATECCSCGAGMAFDSIQDPDWSCSLVLLGKAKSGKHKCDMPFSLVHFTIENGQTTRPKS